MNDKDRDLLMQVLQTAGETGQHGFTYLVRYYFVDGITSFLGWSLALVGFSYLMKRVFAWKAEDEAVVAKVGGIIVLAAVMFGALCGAFDGIRNMAAPEGAAVISALSAVHR